MEKLSSKCSSCGCTIRYLPTSEGRTVKCPKCSESTKLVSSIANIEPVQNIEAEPIEEEISQDASPKEIKLPPKDLPERMKASKALIGVACSICAIEIDLGDDIYNCQTCHASAMHLECFENLGACGNGSCVKGSVKKELHLQANVIPTSSNPAIDPGDMKECKYCGESIKSKSLKCRFCGEYVDPKLRLKESQKKKFQDDEDNILTWGEIIFCILCGCFGLIAGIVYVFQGKKKGWKMIGISLVSSFIFGAIKGSR
jgi:hypothetical protein